jgi:type II secretory pathway component PulK
MNTNSNNKGLVLVGVLWIVIVLTAIVAVLGRKSRLDGKIVLARSESIRAKWACRAGIERAVAILNEDEKDTDGHNDIWYYDPEDFNDFAMNRVWYNVKVTDESGKLNINTATWDQLMGLPYMYQDIADAIIDWRDSDDVVSESGTENGYYENLDFGYINRNAPFRTIRELLLVKGVTDEMFYGEDTNLNGKLDYNEMDGDVNPPADNGDAWLDTGWAAYITCYTSDSTGTTGTTSTQTTGQTGTDQTGQTTGQTSRDTSYPTMISPAANQNAASSAIISFAANQSQNTGSYAPLSPAGYSGGQNTGGQTGQTSGQTGQTSGQTGQTTTQQTTQQNTQQTTQDTTQTTQTTTDTTGQTSGNTGLVNVNTASEVVLAALMGGSNEAYAAAQAIIGYRENLEYGIEDVSELTQNGVISTDMLSMMQDSLTVTSNIYKITCTATADRGGRPGTTLQTEVVIDRSVSPYRVLYWYQGASN